MKKKMKTMSKRTLAVILTLVMLMTAVPLVGLTAFAAETQVSGDFKYEELEDGTAKVTDYTGIATEIVIPEEINGHTVTVLDVQYFSIRYDGNDFIPMKEIKIPKTVTSIPNSIVTDIEYSEHIVEPFSDQVGLEKITVDPENKYYCSENGVLFNKDKTVLISYPKCKPDESYSIPEGVTEIMLSRSEFMKDANEFIKNINIPASLTDIEVLSNYMIVGYHPLYIHAMENINVASGNPKFSSADGVIFNKNKTDLICYPRLNPRNTYTVPNSVRNIKMNAFDSSENLNEVIISDGVKYIESSVFRECRNLSNVTFPDSLESIGSGAFYGCFTNGADIVLPEGIECLGDAFQNSGIINISIPSSVKVIDNEAFCGCRKLKNINVSDENNEYSSIDGVLFNKDKTEITAYPAGKFKLSDFNREYKIPSGVIRICENAFAESLCKRILIPASVVEIGQTAFAGCRYLTSVTIPDGVTNIKQSTFGGCEQLADIILPKSVVSIESGAFSGCNKLTDVYYGGSESDWNKIAIDYDYGSNKPLTSATIHFAEESCSHTFIEEIKKEADCKSEGSKQYKCSLCGEYKTDVDGNVIVDVIPKTGHKNITTRENPATCENPGYVLTFCGDCGAEMGLENLLPLGHEYGEWVVTREPTEFEKGVKEHSCVRCDKTETEEIPCLPQTVKDEQSGIEIEAPSGSYDGKLEMNIEEQYDGTSFDIVMSMDGVTKGTVYDITTTVNGEKVQPGAPVTVRIPLPEGYNPERTFVYHINSETGKPENMNARYEDGYLVFETDHFSIYAVVEEAEPEKDYGVIGNIIKVVIDFVVKVVKIVFEFIKDLFCTIF